MLGRRPGLVVVGIVGLIAFLAVSWPRSLAPSYVSVPSGQTGSFFDTVPPLAPAVTAPPDTTPPEPPPTAEVTTGSGNTLRVGFGVRPPFSGVTVADAIVRRVGLYSSPGQAEPDDYADNPTWEGLPGVYLVHQRQGDWLNVQLSMRPNQATAWIKASEVTLRPVTQRIEIDTEAKTLTAYNGSAPILQASVAPGKGSTPTPTGDYFVDGVVRLIDDSGPYGPYQISVSAFSNVYTSFGGGVGQIAIHGTNSPALIGTPASNGCVRMNNEDISALAAAVPLGTPVHIS